MHWHMPIISVSRRVFNVGGRWAVSRHAPRRTGEFGRAGGDGPMIEGVNVDTVLVFTSRYSCQARAELARLQALSDGARYSVGFGDYRHCCTTGGRRQSMLWLDLAGKTATERGRMLDDLEDSFCFINSDFATDKQAQEQGERIAA